MAKAKREPGSTAAWTLKEQVYAMAHNAAWAALRTIHGVREVQVDTRSRTRHVIQVTCDDGTVRNFTVQVIEHK